jgi:antitoxin (DNA-binding transcriptional repressor) of toxin-antitoxin stability system
MPTVSARDLRTRSAEILERVVAGEEFEVWKGDRPVERLVPLKTRRTWVPAAELIRELARIGPDTTGLADELRTPL